jgi:hypothetical protein
MLMPSGAPCAVRRIDGEGRPPGHGLAGVVEVEDVDPLRRGVDVVHAVAAAVPRQPVGDGDVIQHGGDSPVRRVPIERSRSGLLRPRHAAGVEATARVAFAVVHPVALPDRRFRLGEHGHTAFRREVREPGAGRDQPASALGGNRDDRADRTANLIRTDNL